MAGTKRDVNVRIALEAQRRQLAAGADTPVVRDPDRHSCGSFFMNPVLPADAADRLPQDAPRFPATLPDGTAGVKTSAAWLIDHAGFHKGFKVDESSPAGLSTLHTLALTNRGDAAAPTSRRWRMPCRTAWRRRSRPPRPRAGRRRHGPALAAQSPISCALDGTFAGWSKAGA